MRTISRRDIYQLFNKAEEIHLPEELNGVDFEPLYYFSWIDQTNDLLLMISEYQGKLEGIQWKWIRLGMRPFIFALCDVCKRHRRRDEIMSVSANTKILPAGISYRSKAIHICRDYYRCNKDLKDDKSLKIIFRSILE